MLKAPVGRGNKLRYSKRLGGRASPPPKRKTEVRGSAPRGEPKTAQEAGTQARRRTQQLRLGSACACPGMERAREFVRTQARRAWAIGVDLAEVLYRKR
jgi:hypothetical protein